MKCIERVVYVLRWSFLLLIASTAGCGGCRKPLERLSREELEKRAKEQREAIQTERLMALPSDSESPLVVLKPGHWVETTQRVKSTREDLQVNVVGDVALGSNQVALPGTNIVNEFSRPTILPKGQWKTVDLQFFVPATGKSENEFDLSASQLRLRTKLVSRQLLSTIDSNWYGVNELMRGQYEFVVVTPQPLSYEFLAALDLMHWRGESLLENERPKSYHVTLVKPQDGKVALPSSMISMTSIAAIVWDDLAADDLSIEQKVALVDWIHWGGQLIVSGPGSWARLQDSFLSPLLPVVSATPYDMITSDFASISEKWEVRDSTRANREPLEIVGPAIPGLRFNLAPSGQWIPGTGELVAERTVGRGRTIVTNFPLREPRIYRWKYFSSFFSTALLRRPPRTVVRTENDLVQRWATPYENMEFDPRLSTNFRIAARDVTFASSTAVPTPARVQADPFGGNPRALSFDPFRTPEPRELPPKTFGSDAAEPVQWSENGAAWNDLSGLSFQAINALRTSAGIELPDRGTIMLLLAGYLACLVPVNWLVFRLVGRLEWAWIAAPLIAIVGVVVVTRVAQLDIGFARRNTEVSVLELHGEYPRGHLTRFVALYTSLSTNYALELPDPGSVALPVGDLSRQQRRAEASFRNLRTSYGSSPGMRLEPLTVYSNSTEMLHAEQMVALPKGFSYSPSPDSSDATLSNGTDFTLRSGLVLRSLKRDRFQLSWIGDLAPGESAKVQFDSANREDVWNHWNMSRTTADPKSIDPQTGTQSQSSDSIRVGALLGELVLKVPLVEGQTRLFGYTDERPGKLSVQPTEDQLDSRCVVMAHLTPASLGEVRPDLRIIGRVASPFAAPPLPTEPVEPN